MPRIYTCKTHTEDDFRTPPESWVAQMLGQRGFGRDAALGEWDTLSRSIRIKKHNTAIALKARLVRFAAKVADGTANQRTRSYVEHGGLRHYRSVGEALFLTKKENRARVSASRLQFRLKNAKGCSVKGCPMSAACHTEFPVFHCHLVHEYMDENEKWASVPAMKASDRDEALAKTRVVCQWHRFLNKELSTGQSRPIARLKAKDGCLHPLHSGMEYSGLVREGPEWCLFVEIAHHALGSRRRLLNYGPSKDAVLIQDVEDGLATTYCRFCHKLWTLCEIARLSDAPATTHQYNLLLKRYPAFVQDFEEVTEGFDWEQEKQRIQAAISAAMLA
jgi:hypothetical protein